MKINTKTRYGIRALIEIAMNAGNGGVFQKDISERQDISFKYLDPIISSLKASGLVVNAGGRRSGYALGREADKVSVYDVYKAFESELRIIDCLQTDGKCGRDKQCATKDFWHRLNQHIISFLESTSIGELAEKQKEIDKSEELSMYYI